MKKYFWMMALAATTLFGATACGDDDDDNNSSSTETSVAENVTLPTPALKAEAIKLTLANTEVEIGGKKGRIRSLEIAESERYLITYEDADEARATRAVTPLRYLYGKVTKASDGRYTLAGFGVVELLKKEVAKVKISITPITGVAVEAEGTIATTAAASTLTNYLCRTWTIQTTRVRGKINGTSIAKDFSGKANLNEIVAWLKDKGANIKDELEANTIIEGVTFTASKTYLINYANGQNDVGTWNWTNEATGSLSYTWDSADMAKSYDAGRGTVKFSGNICVLTLPVKADGSEVEAVYTLR